MPSTLRPGRGRRPASPEPTPSTSDRFALIGWHTAFAHLVRYFVLRPEARPRLRELQRHLGLGSASVQRELRRLVEVGAIQRLVEDGQVRYAVAPRVKLWGALRTLVRELSSPAALVSEALRDVPGIDAAFIFGSTAAGSARQDSDIDVLVVAADAVDTRALHRGLAEVGLLLEREVNPVRYTPQELARRLAGGTRFVREVLEGPRVWVAGSPAAIAPIAAAAGVRFDGGVARRRADRSRRRTA